MLHMSERFEFKIASLEFINKTTLTKFTRMMQSIGNDFYLILKTLTTIEANPVIEKVSNNKLHKYLL